ncbi:MAG: GNAT family N-acetyltransferase [Acidimicrobiaceae bacterium]|nr:GNAT family N-acetyltransferase [Acidimicrobiaceae bacterium]
MIEISRVGRPSLEVLEAINRLIPQLSSSAKPLDLDELKRLTDDECVNLLVALETDTKEIIGTLTLVVFPIPSGIRAWIEDVIVDSNSRSKGIGKLLVKRAIEISQLSGAKSVDLTSRPSRVEANSLYLSLGFVLRETNVYRFQGN